MWKLVLVGVIVGLLFLNTSSQPKPLPSPSPKPALISCTHHANCGGVTLQVTEAECTNSTCCDVGGTWSIMSIPECQQKKQDYILGLQEKINEIKSRPRQVIQVPQAPQMNGTKCTTSYDYLGKLITTCRPSW
mgnify:FL=1